MVQGIQDGQRAAHASVDGMSHYHDRAGLKGPRWERLRRRILDRDNWTCQTCGQSAGRMEVDHVVPLHLVGPAWEASNLQTLCRRCHWAKTGGENTVTPISEQNRAGRKAWEELVEKGL